MRKNSLNFLIFRNAASLFRTLPHNGILFFRTDAFELGYAIRDTALPKDGRVLAHQLLIRPLPCRGHNTDLHLCHASQGIEAYAYIVSEERMQKITASLAGLFVSLPALWAGLAVIGMLLALKMVTKYVCVWPLSRYFFMRSREAHYTALLMSTGLTFGTISALFGLQNKIIDQQQYSVLVTVVILSAFVPTLIAQKFFQPAVRTMAGWGRLYQRRINGMSDAGSRSTGK